MKNDKPKFTKRQKDVAKYLNETIKPLLPPNKSAEQYDLHDKEDYATICGIIVAVGVASNLCKVKDEHIVDFADLAGLKDFVCWGE